MSSFVINYANPVKDKILDIASLEKFLQERIRLVLSVIPLMLLVTRARSRLLQTAISPKEERSGIVGYKHGSGAYERTIINLYVRLSKITTFGTVDNMNPFIP
ncbi:ribosomal L22e family protein [Medicago truncatula]|uniref:Ribosomal L22e family protein n=1 Tax=Medicago truncatula TaxID=3880 RepID=G7IZY1_MEDTR|nr:ribosomal L22e family protein [Medicago truncatula]